MPLKRRIIMIICAVAVFFAILPFPRNFSGMKIDPDRFYHFAISKIYANDGFPKTLPQADDIGWKDTFAEKEYLFHLITGLGYKFSGEMGVLWVSWILYAAIATTLGFILSYYTNSLVLLPLGAIAAMLATGTFSPRMLMVRPHVLAILLMTWQIFSWSRGWWIAGAIFGALYCLAYHAVYIPILITLFFLTCQLLAGKNIKRPAIWSFAAIVIAILINPAFPWNVATGVQHAFIALNQKTEIPEFVFGAELRKLRSDILLRLHGFYMLMPFLLLALMFFRGLWQVNKKETWRPLIHPELAASTALCLVFSCLTFLTPRAYEILVPAIFILIAAFSATYKSPAKAGLACILLMAAFMGHSTYEQMKSIETSNLESRNNTEIASLLEMIPKDRPAKIYNANWSDAPYIFYNRPDLKFVDLLDPTFLANKSSEKSDLKMRIAQGGHPDPWLAIYWDFRSDYVLARKGSSRSFQSPLFKQIHPPKEKTSSAYQLFQVQRERPDRFLTRYKTGIFKVDQKFETIFESMPDRNLIEPSNLWPKQEDHEPNDISPKRVFVDTFEQWTKFSNQNSQPDASKSTICMRVIPDQSEIDQILQKNPAIKYLGIGGGNFLALWINQKPMYKSPKPISPRTTNILLEISDFNPKALKDFDALICAPPDSRLSGLVLSFWSISDLEKSCERSKPDTNGELPENWQFAESPMADCLGLDSILQQTSRLRQ